MKTCTKCDTDKDPSDFYAHPKTADRKQQVCKSCMASARRAYGKTAEGRVKLREAAKRPSRREASKSRQQTDRDSVAGRARHMLHNAKSSAKRAGVAFDLTLPFLVERLTPLRCEATGLAFDWSKSSLGRVNPRTPSLDRISEKGGYTMNNIRVVCWQFNLARNTYGDAMLMEMAAALVGQSAAKPRKGKVQRLSP